MIGESYLDIVTNEHYYLSDGGKIHFYYDEDDAGYYLCNRYWNGKTSEYNSSEIREFRIPDTINGKPVIGIDGDTFDGMKNISAFKVSTNNSYFSLYHGGLYSKDMKEIIQMPPNYQEKTFHVPDCVEFILDSAISCPTIETLILSANCKKIYEYGIACVKSLKRIYIPKSVAFIGFKAFIWTTPEDVFYSGTESDREHINFTDEGFNSGILNAHWHYNCVHPVSELTS